MKPNSAALLFLFSINVFASEQVICTSGEQMRKITLSYSQEDSVLPCEVNYEKSTGTQLLWKASSEAGFCERKMAEFIEKQRSWGWTCSGAESVERAQIVVPEPSTSDVGKSDDLLDGIDLENP